jgi:glycosyltransferase involved in cell wall biosynthesis
MKTILLISPYWKEPHRWMVSSVKLAELWQRLGYQVNVVCMGPRNDKTPEKIREHATVQFKKDIFLKDPWNYGICFGFSGLIRKRVKAEKPDYIVVNKLLFWTSLSIIPLALRGQKVILLIDALVGMTWWPRGKIPRIAAAIYAWTIGWLLLRLAHKIVFFHPQPDSLLKKLGIKEKSEVIPTGIDPDPYSDADTLRNMVEGIYVTYVGRLESVKGVDDFLAAVTPLKKSHSELMIQVAGWAKPNHPLVEQYQKDVSFLGLRDDIPLVLARSHIFVLPSHSEGLSNALMEAMASGCACIASEVGGNAYLIQNGVSGLLYPVGDIGALRAHVERLLQDSAKRRSLGEKARARIEAEFSWETVGNMYRELFEGLA